MYNVEEYVEFLLDLVTNVKTNEEKQKLIEISKTLLEMSVKLNNNVISVDWRKNPQTYDPNRTNTTPFELNPYLTCTARGSEVGQYPITEAHNA